MFSPGCELATADFQEFCQDFRGDVMRLAPGSNLSSENGGWCLHVVVNPLAFGQGLPTDKAPPLYGGYGLN